MKILMVNKFFDLRDGVDIYAYRVMEELRRRGHEVHVFSTRSSKNMATPDAERFVRRLNFDRHEGALKDAGKAFNFIWNREAKHAMESWIEEFKPDVVHLHNIYHHLTTSILKPIRESKTACVQTLHDYKLACPNYKMFVNGSICERCKGGHYLEAVKNKCLFGGLAGNVLAALEMGLAKSTQAYESTVKTFICPSRFMRDKMGEWGEPPGKLTYLPNPVDVPSETPPDRCTGPFVYIGRLYPEKGIEVLVRAVANLPAARLDIVGDGILRQSLENLIVDLRAADRIRLLGFKTGQELTDIRNGARALCVPSIWYENAPLTVLEAMAVGLPVIASDIGGLPELVEDGVSGFLAKPSDVDGWMEALEQMESFTVEQRREMGNAGREFVTKKMNWDEHVSKLEELYRA